MKFAILNHNVSSNISNEIQGVAAERLLPPLKWRCAINKPKLMCVQLNQEKVQNHKQQLIADFNHRLNKLLTQCNLKSKSL